MTYDQMVKNLANFLRDELRQLEEISSLDFEITIDGRVHDGDINIEYKLGSTYSTGGCVKGGNLPQVVDEYKRRFGWDRRNAALCIGFNGEIKQADD